MQSASDGDRLSSFDTGGYEFEGRVVTRAGPCAETNSHGYWAKKDPPSRGERVGALNVPKPWRAQVSTIAATIAATMLDVAADMQRAAGIDNAATVIIELSEQEAFDVASLAQLAPTFPAAAGRRVGWLLSRFTGRDDLSPLKDTVHNLVDSPSKLDPYSTVGGPIDTDWMLTTNRDVEPDSWSQPTP